MSEHRLTGIYEKVVQVLVQSLARVTNPSARDTALIVSATFTGCSMLLRRPNDTIEERQIQRLARHLSRADRVQLVGEMHGEAVAGRWSALLRRCTDLFKAAGVRLS